MKKQATLQEAPSLESGIVGAFPTPPARKTEEYLKAYTGYAFTAVSAIAQEVASIELLLYKAKYARNGEVETAEIKQHKILSFLTFANPLMTFYDLIEATQTYLELVGEAFWIVLREGKNGEPKEAYLVRPDWMYIVSGGTSVIDHYIYKPGGSETDKIEIPKENVIHFKYFNPTNPYRGKGSIQAAAMPLDIFTFASDWTRNFFFNNATPGLVFTTDKKLDEKVVRRFIEQWRATHEGREKAHKIAFLGGGFKLDKTSLSPSEISFSDLQKQMRDDILAVFKVPKTVLGLTEDVNRANAEATTRAFMERVITPRMKKLVGVLNEFLVPMFKDQQDLFLDFVDPSPEDVEQKLKRYESGRKYGWLTPNEIRAEENLEPIEGGDTLEATALSTKPTTAPEDQDEDMEEEKAIIGIRPLKKRIKHMVAIPKKRPEVLAKEQLVSTLSKGLKKIIGDMLRDGYVPEKKKEEELPPINTENKYSMNQEQRDIHWKKLIDVTDKWEPVVNRVALDIFSEEEKIILSNIAGSKHWIAGKRKGRENSFLQTLSEMSKAWVSNLVPVLREIILEVGRQALDFVGVGGDIDLTDNEAQKYLREKAGDLIDEINTTTREKLKNTLADGFGEGESIDELSERVKNVFAEAKTSRAQMISRSEVLRASNFATVLAYKQADFITGKEWLTATDEKVCPFCGAMDGKVVDLDSVYFKKGDSLTVKNDKGKDQVLKFDLFSVGYPPLHPSCRCTLIPFIAQQKEYVPEITQEETINKIDPKEALIEFMNETLEENVNGIKEDLEIKSADFLKKKKEELEKEYKFNKEINLKTANEIGIKLVKDAGDMADKLISEAEAKVSDLSLKESEKKQRITEAKTEAKNLIKKAKEDAKKIKEQAILEAKVEKEAMLQELKGLRSQVQEVLKSKNNE